ncbi:MAG: S41 family peptidase [Gammaproteobacteria bacterium]
MTRGRTVAAVGVGLALGVAAALALPSAWRAFVPARAAVPGADGRGAPSAAASRPGPLATLEASLPPAEARRLAEILGRVRREYVDEVPAERLLDEAARGMVASLDPHSAYLDRREYEDIRRGAAGSYPGIGIEVVAEGEAIKVLRPIDDSPAWRAGIRAGDVILRIDDSPVRGDVAAAIDQMRGPAGSLVRLLLRRAGSREVVEVALERTRVEVHSVSGMLLDDRHGYLRIANFSETTPADFDRHVAELRKLAPALRGVVIDLRDNPGGVLEAAVAVADSMLESGNIVSASGRTADARFRMDARPGQMLAGVDVVLLVNRGSASAAEILAGALKDNGRARLLGARTYGKGSVQSVIPLSDGRALKITTSRYATPSGTLIQERGIDPDLPVAATPPRFEEPHLDPGVKAAVRELRQMWDLHRREGMPESRSAGVRPPHA